jgi:hypothetical protein
MNSKLILKQRDKQEFCTQNVNLSISAITSPVNTYIEAGSATSLVCAVAGSPGTATYAWYKVVDDGSTAVDGATDATYTISTPATADNGGYYCQVTMTVSGVANGPFSSETATLYVRGKILPKYYTICAQACSTSTFQCDQKVF